MIIARGAAARIRVRVADLTGKLQHNFYDSGKTTHTQRIASIMSALTSRVPSSIYLTLSLGPTHKPIALQYVRRTNVGDYV